MVDILFENFIIDLRGGLQWKAKSQENGEYPC
jgi:hypothetical protein